ncbi:MAG: aminotransferase class I/II-fold pyridoxal phosphate-dependent enzyme [Gemmatales bacterium]
MQPTFGPSVPLAPAFIPSSVYALPDLDALEAISTGQQTGFIYARDNHPNAVQLEQELARLENAAGAVVCSNGMAAIGAVAMATLHQGGRVIASNFLYGRTTQLFFQEMTRFGVEVVGIDTGDLTAVRSALADNPENKPTLMVVETLSNPLLATADLPAIIKLCNEHESLLLVDNTFASPILCRPIELGADFVIESITKIIGGHSDITLGVVLARDVATLVRLRQVRSIWGWMGDPFPCWLALRGLPTLRLRMLASCDNANKLAHFLRDQPGVSRVIHPSLSKHPDHALCKKMLGGHYGNMLCMELAGGRAAVNRFFQKAPALKFCPSLGDYATTCSHPASTSHRYLDPAERERQSITEGLIRVSVGIEPWEELAQAFRVGLES